MNMEAGQVRDHAAQVWNKGELSKDLKGNSEVKLKIVKSIMSIFTQNSKVWC